MHAGELNKGSVQDVLPLDFVPGKYTVAVSDPSNNIRGMTFVSVRSPVNCLHMQQQSTLIAAEQTYTYMQQRSTHTATAYQLTLCVCV